MKKLVTSITLLVLIILLFIGYYLLITNKIPDWGTRGQIGDTFGVLNSLFSGIAIIGIVYTLIQQNDIININKNDNEIAKKQFMSSIKQYEQQQQIQTLSTLISIYEKKLDQYKKSNDKTLIIETDKKLNDLMSKLEEKIS